MGTRTALERVAQTLRDKGISATTDPRAVYPPCVVLDVPDEEVPDTMCGASFTSSAWVVVPGPYSVGAWDAIDALVDSVLPLLRGGWSVVYRKRMFLHDGVDLPAAEIVMPRTPSDPPAQT